jgi:hypothetical protein
VSAAPPASGEDERVARARRRRNGFALHVAGYFLVVAIVVPLNLFLLAPGTPWFLLPMVGWGAVLAVHCAFAMGLFDRALSGRR